ncbi:MAG TPA: ATP-dependent DNA helicase RecG [Fimbriimonadaceae bacterium]|nr:ATP-dependent DNA helicase RecG [Fimbriimonadaceae bacterium]
MATKEPTTKAGTDLDMDVQYLKGVGPKNAMLLKKLGIETVRQILWHTPRRYEDRREIPPISHLRPGQYVTVRGNLVDIKTRRISGGRVLLKAWIDDDTGRISLVWFNQPWVARQLQKVTGEIVAFGLVKEGDRVMEMHSPEWEPIGEDEDSDDFARLVPVYPLTEGVPQYVVRKAARSAAERFAQLLDDPLPEAFRKRHKLPALSWCVRQIHLPDDLEARDKAKHRMAFEEFFYLQLMLQMRRQEVQQEVGVAFPVSKIGKGGASGAGNLFAEGAKKPIKEEVAELFPFALTAAQNRVIGEIWADMERPAPMNRLLQGDVGSGKTAVAAAAMLAAVRCGYQAALMAPTEILAEQHYINIHRMFDPLGIATYLMAGKQTAAQRRKALDAAMTGQAQICIGTHALVQEGVEFSKLGLAIIDEQHRFGVLQRAALRAKGVGNPDVLVMTATPIPRTLTMTLYGDLDLSVIDELPPGRKPVKTHWKQVGDREKVYGTVRQLINEGRQAYFVCPLISESKKMEVQAAEDLYYRLTKGAFSDKRVGLLHGQLKTAEKEETMEMFRRGELDILVSTVVIEVGVDVPNASVMVIEDADRFGLSQLHQLRGRVGRGEDQSFCILIAKAQGEESRRRMEILVQTNDGFKIAEEDLNIRGAGNIAGTEQHGRQLSFVFADLLQDGVLLERARTAAIQLLEEDPGLAKREHAALLARVRDQRSERALVSVS